MGHSKGKIITFYSYKGGTGRTMALANAASLLTTSRYGDNTVLMIDWDLEAPGLHNFFRPVAHDASSVAGGVDQPGLIDFIRELSSRIPAQGVSEEAVETLVSEAEIGPYVLQTQVPKLHLMKAGRFDSGYVERTATFGWEDLHRRAPGVFLSLADTLAQQYDYILIDSRTGYTDTSGICTMLMPEKLVAVFTPNMQSLTGVIEVVRQATRFRRESADLRPLTVFPLASRVEAAEPELRRAWRYGDPARGIVGFQPRFEDAFKDSYGFQQCALDDYFDEVQIQHVPRYAYGEEIAVLSAVEGDRLSLSRSYESFADRLVAGVAPWEKRRQPQEVSTVATFGRYEILGQIEQGAMGTIYKAKDPMLNREVILKTISTGLELDAGARERFRRETKSAAQLHHKNIATIYDVGEAAGQTYIVMELLDGEDLQTKIRRREPIALAEQVRIMLDVCRGLAYVHGEGLLHGDIKPSNILVTPSGDVKLMDAGLGRLTTTGLTQTGIVTGTPAYMSPEQVRGQPTDVRSDIFSTGVVFYEFLTGQKPFDAESLHGVLFKIMEGEPTPIEAIDPSVPAQLSTIVMRALAKKPEERYQNAKEMIFDLEVIRRSMPGQLL